MFNKNEYPSLHEDILKCLGRSLKDNELKSFISKYQISCEDKYNDKLFICRNDFLKFQNRDQRRQKINEFHIQPNNIWLPYGITQTDTLQDISQKFGEPDRIDYNFNSFFYYDKLIIINFHDIKNHQSSINKITYSNNLRNKPSEQLLVQWRKDKLLYSKNIPPKVFGLNSKWLIIQSKEFHKALELFEVNEKDRTEWQEGFKNSTIRESGIFISQLMSDKILIHGWSLPPIESQKVFYTNLSSELGTVFYFENHIKTPFAWAKINNGLTERVFREEYLEIKLNTGDETEFEISENFKKIRESLREKKEEYNSDQDVKIEYRTYMNEFVLELATNWIFDPRTMDEIELPDKVYLNKDYRQQFR